MTSDQSYWKKCSSCKKEIPFSTLYYVCSVSTCRHKRKGFQFCSVQCWDAHLGFMNHREAWAKEEHSPSKASSVQSESRQGSSTIPSSTERKPMRKIVSSGVMSQAVDSTISPKAQVASQIETDTLVVVSKVKKLIKDQSGFNTSQCCVDALTKKVVEECLKAIEQAKKAERKTVMARDVR